MFVFLRLNVGPKAFPALNSEAASPTCLRTLSPVGLQLCQAPTSKL